MFDKTNRFRERLCEFVTRVWLPLLGGLLTVFALGASLVSKRWAITTGLLVVIPLVLGAASIFGECSNGIFRNPKVAVVFELTVILVPAYWVLLAIVYNWRSFL